MNNQRIDAGFALFLHYLSICDVIKVGEYFPAPQYISPMDNPAPLDYWLRQYKQILNGETGPDMHDSSLVFPAWRDDPDRSPVCIWV